MTRTHKLLSASYMVAAFALSPAARAYQAPGPQAFAPVVRSRVSTAALWRDRGNIESLNLFYGSGAKERMPIGKLTFLKEDPQATSPKFEIVDQQGVHWKVKLGGEVKSETAATRLVWAAGYFTDEDYYLSELRVENMPKLHRGRQFVSADGVVHGVRLERGVNGQKKIDTWSWSKNPLAGTKELNGLRIMMALMNNWDVKDLNNAIYEEPGEDVRYVVSDLGATFGKTGGVGDRTKSLLRDYAESKFIAKIKAEEIDLTLKSRPFFLMAIDYYHYQKLAARAKVGQHIPRTHAKWMGQLLGRLSAEQIRDCFRAGGYSPAEVEGFAKVIQGRIADLNRL